MPTPTLPPLPEPYSKEVIATWRNTPTVRQGYEMGGYVKTPALFSDAQMTTYGQARADAARADLLAEVERLRAESVVRIDIHDIRPAEVLKRVILNLEPKRGRPLWALVHEATAHGSTVSAGLCRWAGRDPDTGAAIDSANQGESK